MEKLYCPQGCGEMKRDYNEKNTMILYVCKNNHFYPKLFCISECEICKAFESNNIKKLKINANIDWELLRKQKLTLLRLINKKSKEQNDLRGILSLIDNVQDSAVGSGAYTEKEVFDL